MSKTIEMDGYTYTLPFTVDDANNDLVDANGGYFGMHSVSPAELVTIAAALNDYRPWRYPAKGELPSDLVFKEITRAADDVIDLAMFQNNRWWMRDGGKVGVRAWRELPAPAPVIETEDESE